jgi:CheY-like chemotaxis protein
VGGVAPSTFLCQSNGLGQSSELGGSGLCGKDKRNLSETLAKEWFFMTTRLLVAEPSSTMAELYRQAFSAAGYEVVTASGGLECLVKLREDTPDLLVLDLDLPWGGGDGVLTMMREDEDIPRIPVVVTANSRHDEAMTERLTPPVVQYVQKPFSLATLLTSIGLAFQLGQKAAFPQPFAMSN